MEAGIAITLLFRHYFYSLNVSLAHACRNSNSVIFNSIKNIYYSLKGFSQPFMSSSMSAQSACCFSHPRKYASGRLALQLD